MRREIAYILISIAMLAGCTSSARQISTVASENLKFENAIRHQIAGCWMFDPGLPGLENMTVTINAELDPDGTVRSAEYADKATVESGTAAYKEFAESARRSVLRCSPLQVPPSRPYEEWKTMTFNFSAKDMIQ